MSCVGNWSAVDLEALLDEMALLVYLLSVVSKLCFGLRFAGVGVSSDHSAFQPGNAYLRIGYAPAVIHSTAICRGQ
jgi:hypothetical protein